MRDYLADKFMRSLDPIDEKIRELGIKHETLAMPPAIRYDKDKVQTSPKGDAMDNTAQRLIDIELQINALCDERADCVDRIFAALDFLENGKQRIILIRYYIRHERMEKIAEDMHYDLSWAYRLLRTGLKKLSGVLKNPPSTFLANKSQK